MSPFFGDVPVSPSLGPLLRGEIPLLPPPGCKLCALGSAIFEQPYKCLDHRCLMCRIGSRLKGTDWTCAVCEMSA